MILMWGFSILHIVTYYILYDNINISGGVYVLLKKAIHYGILLNVFMNVLYEINIDVQ